MASTKKYTIDIAQLEPKAYHFEMEADGDFFKDVDIVGFVTGSFTAGIDLEKSDTMLDLDIKLEGALRLICDRSLDEFDMPLKAHQKLILKFGDHDEDLDDELRMIQRGTQRIDLYQDLFDIVMLSIPMKKLHPRYAEEQESGVAGKVVYQTEPLTEEKEKEAIDPRWAALKNIKFNN